MLNLGQKYDVKNDVLFYDIDMSHATLIHNVPGPIYGVVPR
jgi:hypothetical protein